MGRHYPGSVHNHTDYSNLRLRDSINRVESLIDKAIELGHDCVAITEHETVANAIKVQNYYNKIKKNNPEFKVILGNEIYLCRDGIDKNYVPGEDKFYHFILLAKDAEGHEQIRELSTRAWVNHSFKQGIMTRVPTYYSDLVEVIGNNPGHVIGSTACLGGLVATKILEYSNSGNQLIYDGIVNWCNQMKKLFGEGNFYLEMQPSNNIEQTTVNQELLKLSRKLDIPYIITTDSHYLSKDKAPIHKAYLNSQDGDREVDDFYATTYMMSTEELETFFSYFTPTELEVAYNNITKIKDMCVDYSLKKDLVIPALSWKEPTVKVIDRKYFNLIPNLKLFAESDYDGDVILAQMVVSKLESDARLQTQQIYDEINQNLDATWKSSEVNNTHWSAYFLNLQKIIEVCWESGTLVGPGRGSGVGFILLYLLDIIQINPLWETTKCFSWRFLNPERVSVLDIDTDIEGGRRAQVLEGLRKYYGQDRVANVVTFGTEKSKSALQTAARGLGIDNDISLYLSSLIPADRGQTRTLRECYYGDAEKGFSPIPIFVNEMTNNYPELWRVALEIEGLVCRVGEHAGGVIFVDEPFTKSTALMKVPNGDVVTQFDLHDDEAASLIKMDLLSVECLDKIHACIDLLTEYGYIDSSLSLKERYEEAIGIYNIERNDQNMWEMIWNHDIHSLFQMEQQSGIQGIDLIKPKSVDELAVLNSVIRLMAPDQDSDRPLESWAKYRKDISGWIKEMKVHGLTNEEIDWLSHHSAITDGICESQEGLMSLVQEERLGGNSLTFADKCRKGIAKKQGSLFQECEDIFYKNIEEKHCSDNLAHYVWDVLLKVQRGYSFNRSHCLAYSLIALQEMNLCFKYPIIYWNTACLIVDSGSMEDNSEEEIVDIYEPEKEEMENGVTYEDLPDRSGKIKKTSSTDYSKLAKAIGNTLTAGIKISLVDINKSTFTFKPDEDNNIILYGMKGLLNVSDDIIAEIIAGRPYTSVQDFYDRIKPKKQTMISLIKAGAFDNMMDRIECMKWYIWQVCEPKKNITLQNMSSLIKYNILPRDKEFVLPYRVYEFNRYLKAKCKQGANYKIDNPGSQFLIEIDCDNLIGGDMLMSAAKWDKVYQSYMDTFRNWIANDKTNILEALNETLFVECWNTYAAGSISTWEMEVMCFYYHEHELINVKNSNYGIKDFNTLSEEPVVDNTFEKGGKVIKLFKLDRIAGTCIAKDKNKGTVTLLTTTGVVTVKMSKEFFALYDRQISVKGEDGKKHVLEKSWFNRGNMIMVTGVRSGDMFLAKKYSSTPGHRLYKITNVNKDGSIGIIGERVQGE